MNKPIDPQRWLKELYEGGPKIAKAKAELEWLQEYRKSLKAILMQKSAESSAAMKEVEAYANPEYLTHLDALKIAVENHEALRWKMVTAQAAIDVWRSSEASNRAMDRAAA
jgi:ethanolamine utilization cobalamin adenosyltransferase